MRLTKESRATLRRVLAHAERARAFIHSDRVMVCAKSSLTTATIKDPDGNGYHAIAKGHGSDLCGIDMAIDELAGFLVRH